MARVIDDVKGAMYAITLPQVPMSERKEFVTKHITKAVGDAVKRGELDGALEAIKVLKRYGIGRKLTTDELLKMVEACLKNRIRCYDKQRLDEAKEVAKLLPNPGRDIIFRILSLF